MQNAFEHKQTVYQFLERFKESARIRCICYVDLLKRSRTNSMFLMKLCC